MVLGNQQQRYLHCMFAAAGVVNRWRDAPDPCPRRHWGLIRAHAAGSPSQSRMGSWGAKESLGAWEGSCQVETKESGLMSPLILAGSLSHKCTHGSCDFEHHSSYDLILPLRTVKINPQGVACFAALRESTQRRQSDG